VSIASFAAAGGQGGAELGTALAPLGFAGVSNAQSLRRGAATQAERRYFGLSMRFTVAFSNGAGIDQLGEWSSCRGLKVDFRTESVRVGGSPSGEVKLPTQVLYPPVTLERAMELETSRRLQVWLGKLATAWQTHAAQPRGTVSIVLYDVHDQEVAAWDLHNAYPVSWSGPVLDAKQNAVALESLTLEHEGFLPQSPA
jgi:phage tail-like protein